MDSFSFSNLGWRAKVENILFNGLLSVSMIAMGQNLLFIWLVSIR